MEASLVVPGPLDVAGTLSRLHLWGEDPANRFGTVSFVAHHDGSDTLARLPNDEVIERLTTVRGFGRWSVERAPAGARGRDPAMVERAVRRAVPGAGA